MSLLTLLPRTESHFDLPVRPTYFEMTKLLSCSLITKRHIVLVCKGWNQIATPLLYSTVLLRTTRGVTAAWNTFHNSSVGTRLGHLVQRIDFSMRDSRLLRFHSTIENDAERAKVMRIFWSLPNLSIFTMHTHFCGGDRTYIAKALMTSASTLHTIEWGSGYMDGHVCLSRTTWAKLVSSCPNLKSLEGPECVISSTVLHPTARLSHLSILDRHRGFWKLPPNPPTPLHICCGSASPPGVLASHIISYCHQATSLDVWFHGKHNLDQFLAQCPKLSQLVIRTTLWSNIPPNITLDSSITHLGLFVLDTDSMSIVEGLGWLVTWEIPGVKILRFMIRDPILEGRGLKTREIPDALLAVRAMGIVLEDWRGKPFDLEQVGPSALPDPMECNSMFTP